MKNLFDGFHKGGDAGVKHDHGNDHGAEVFYAPVAEGMLFIRLHAGQLGADDGNERAAGIRDVVDRVQHDGDGMAHQADCRLEDGEEHVGNNPDDAGPDDRFFAGAVIPGRCGIHRQAVGTIRHVYSAAATAFLTSFMSTVGSKRAIT